MTTFNSSRIVLAFSAIGLAVSVSTFAAQAPKSTDLLMRAASDQAREAASEHERMLTVNVGN